MNGNLPHPIPEKPESELGDASEEGCSEGEAPVIMRVLAHVNLLLEKSPKQ